MKKAEAYFKQLSNSGIKTLTKNIIAGLPGGMTAGVNSINDFKKILKTYEGLSNVDIHNNLIQFLKEIIPVAEKNNIKMALHPDDPPYQILGLPRVVCSEKDITGILNAINSPSNGVCFCTGSFGVMMHNDLPGMVRKLGNKINFIHLRSTKRDLEGSFYESDHLGGDVDMFNVMKELVIEQQKRSHPIPMRPDHGHQMLDDLTKKTNPGYSAIGRLRGLAELRGLESGIIGMMKN
nr:mannonate dehydratase [Mangrovivirga cuniculi]